MYVVFCALSLFKAYVVIIGYQFCIYVRRMDKPFDKLDVKYSISLSSGKLMNWDQVLRGCTILVDGRELFIDLVVLDMHDYEVILRMD